MAYLNLKELLAGGKAHGRPDSDFSARQIAKGEKVELEHTDSKPLAHAIAKDHLAEIPDYYDRLDKMEESAKKEASLPRYLKGIAREAEEINAGLLGKVRPYLRTLNPDPATRAFEEKQFMLDRIRAATLGKNLPKTNLEEQVYPRAIKPRVMEEGWSPNWPAPKPTHEASNWIRRMGEISRGRSREGLEFMKKKQAGDMPHFLDQDRPAKVKEIYSAIKRDHPDMPAEMKARIAARKGKKSPESRKPPETGGPKYKAPITPWHEKQSALNLALGQLWSEGPGQFSKHAAASYFTYRINKDERDQNALGSGFCKLAHHIHKEPWDLAKEVVHSYRGMEYLSKTASNPDQRELAQFYVAWGEGIIKSAGLWDKMIGGARSLGSGAKALGQKLLPGAAKATGTAEAAAAKLPGAAKGVEEAAAKTVGMKAGPSVKATSPAPTSVPGGGAGGVPAAEAKPTMKDYAWGIGVPALAGAGLGYGVASANS